MPVDAVQDVVSETFVLGACLSRPSSYGLRTVPGRSAGGRLGWLLLLVSRHEVA